MFYTVLLAKTYSGGAKCIFSLPDNVTNILYDVIPSISIINSHP